MKTPITTAHQMREAAANVAIESAIDYANRLAIHSNTAKIEFIQDTGDVISRAILAIPIAEPVLPEGMEKLVCDLLEIADASKRVNGSDIPLGEMLRKCAAMIPHQAQEISDIAMKADVAVERLKEAERQIAKSLVCESRYAHEIHRTHAALGDRFTLVPPDGGDVKLHEAAKAAVDALSAAEARAEKAEACLKDAVREITCLLALNDSYGPFGGEIYEDMVDRTWESARAFLKSQETET
jgi:hypothetical protein